MPEIARIALKRGSVANGLAQIKRDLLPEEFTRDYLVQWVMSFDALEKESNQRDYRNDRGDRIDSQDWGSQLWANLVISILQTQMPFYFASLFHIGRMWQVAVFSLESIDDVEREENLLASAQNLMALNTQDNVDLSIESYVALITRMCKQGREQQVRQLNLARELWRDWKSEVELYRSSVNEFEESFNRYRWEYEEHRRLDRGEGNRFNIIMRPTMELLFLAMRGSFLKGKMQSNGVQFKSEIATQPLALQSISAFLAVLTLLNTDEGSRLVHLLSELVEEQKYHLREQRELSRRQLLAPELEAALEMLKRKYEEADPFVKYGAGKSAPTPELLELIREHRLPNGNDSPWLSAWKKSLDEAPSRYDKLSKPSKQSGQALNLSVRLADSTIKRNLTKKLDPAESWEDFLQRIFEKEWIEVIGVMAGKTNQEAKSSTLVWDLQTFQRFIADTVVGLNKLAYSLVVPGSTRLALLFEKASKSKNYYEEIKW